jgi:anthranilate synthase component 1
LDLAVPTVRSFSVDFEPLRLIARFPGSYPALLESSAPAERGRFDIMPISSGECLRLRGGRLTGPGAGAGGFLAALHDWWTSLKSTSTDQPLPFSGGWLLYLGYEIAAEIEPRLRLPPSADSVTALAIRTPAAWIRDRVSGQAWLVAEPEWAALLDEFEDRVRRTVASAPCSAQAPTHVPPSAARFLIQEEDPARFLAGVARSLQYIAAGDVYQVNLSRQWRVALHPATATATATGAATDAGAATGAGPGAAGAGGMSAATAAGIYERLRSTNPSPFAAFLQHEGFALMSSSPERLLAVRAGTVSTRPIAGTRPRGLTAESDAQVIDSLLANEKERAEHVMLIDLERNDLGRVCAPGSVRVDEYMTVETYAHVHHIVSNVSGRLAEHVSPVDVIRALFPGGTITGCPKVRCMEIIAELEATARGAYTGSIGYLNRDGSCDLNILIRTLTADVSPSGPTLSFRAGAGIVADSDSAQELAETRAKAKGMLRALDAAS